MPTAAVGPIRQTDLPVGGFYVQNPACRPAELLSPARLVVLKQKVPEPDVLHHLPQTRLESVLSWCEVSGVAAV